MAGEGFLRWIKVERVVTSNLLRLKAADSAWERWSVWLRGY